MKTVREVIKYFTSKDVYELSPKYNHNSISDELIDYITENNMLESDWSTIDKYEGQYCIFSGLNTFIIRDDLSTVILEFDYKHYGSISVFCLLK